MRQCSQKDTFSFKMTSEAIEEFKDLKEVICSDTCLAHPDMDKEFYIHVDASGVGIGAILTQLDENRRHRIIEYASTAFSNGKDKSNPEREAYGINWALEHFKYYVLGRNPIIYCDCSCLMDIFKTRDQSKSRIFNVWITRLLHYSPRLLHKPGKLMAIPDALSRSSRHYVEYKESDSQDVKINLLEKMVQNALQNATQRDITLRKQGNMLDDYAVSEEQWDDNLPQLRDTLKCNAMVTRSRSRAEEKEELPDNDGDVPMPDAVSNSQHNDQEPAPAANSSPQDNVSMNELVVKQRSDPVLSRIIEHLEFSSKRKRCNNLSMKIIRSIVNQYSIDENGVLRIDVVPVEANSHDNPIVLPSSMVEMVLKQYHDTLLGGHQNAEKMLANLRRHYYFDGMVQYVHYYCSTCEACQISTRFKTPTAPLKPYFASYPNVLVHLDCTPGPNMTKPTKRGNSHILIVSQSHRESGLLSKIPIYFCCPNIFFNILRHTTAHNSSSLFFPVAHYSTQRHTTAHSGTLQHTNHLLSFFQRHATAHSGTLQHTTHLLSFFQRHTTAHSSTLQHTTHLLSFFPAAHYSTQRHTTAHSGTLQHTNHLLSFFQRHATAHSGTLQHTTHLLSFFQRHTTAHSGTLQHTPSSPFFPAARYSTQQHTTTHTSHPISFFSNNTSQHITKKK